MPRIAPSVTVVCTNHLSPEQAQEAWDALVRDILLPIAIRDAAEEVETVKVGHKEKKTS